MSQPTWIGRTIKQRYKLDRLLGQGGMSAVYRATDPNLRRTVAVKLIHGHLATDPEFVRRFEEEAAAVARLRHPNIIQVFDFDHDGPTYYMVLEYLPGETLFQAQTRLKNAGQTMPVSQATTLAIKLCEAVDYAHRQGMIHRDLKPGNVMINPEGEPVLMDFGIAKIVGGASHTATGSIIGTVAYMAPEQIQGEEIDSRIDIYALGIILYEMLSGVRPFEGKNTAATMMSHIQDPVPDITQYSSVPAPIVAVIQRALEKDRDRRFQTAGEMANALRAAVSGATEILPQRPAGGQTPLSDQERTIRESAPPPRTQPQSFTQQPTSFDPFAGQQRTTQEPMSRPQQRTTQEPASRPQPRTGATHAAPPPVQAAANPTATGRSGRSPILVIGGVIGAALALLVCIGGAAVIGNQLGLFGSSAVTPTAAPTEMVADGGEATALPTTAVEPTAVNTPDTAATETHQAVAALDEDCDGDGLTNGDEAELGTEECNADTDGDGVDDFTEVDTYGTDPLSQDTDGDSLSDAAETIADSCTSAINADTDGDGIPDGSDPEPCIGSTPTLPPLLPTFTHTPPPTPTEQPPPTSTSAPVNTPPPALSAQITDISINGDRYAVFFNTSGFVANTASTHVHFFFNTVTPENAGVPGSGPWILYGTPSPFTGYGPADRGSATAMCILVANANHSVQANSGNCYPLPDA